MNIVFVLVYVAVAGSKVESARYSEDIRNWKGDKNFYFPGDDDKVHIVRADEKNIDKDMRNWKGYNVGDRYFYFPGEDGKIHKVDSTEPVDRDHIHNFTRDPNNIGYWLYTRSNPKSKQVLQMGDTKSVRRSHFKPNKITVFTVHGWLGNGDIEFNRLLTKVFLKDHNVNVIVVDWSAMADTLYCTAKEAVAKVGEMIGEIISWLSDKFRMKLKKVHLVGHSLGAHVVGNAGKALNGKARRITGLDPAGPLWYLDNNRLSDANARYVEVIHTNAFLAGYPFSCGHSDHYPNGGSLQPGCNFWDLSCHHCRSWRLMASSIEDNHFRARKCHNMAEALTNTCTGRRGYMGNSDVRKHQSGIYRVNTKSDYPY